jgi:ribosomal protein S18 acetylase RimI-like enzyme
VSAAGTPSRAAAAPSDAAGTSSDARPAPALARAASAGWRVRRGRPEDAVEVAAAVAQLLVELGGTPPEQESMEASARGLLEDPRAGVVVIAEAEDATLVGVLAVSLQTAIHAAGRYALIQDLWVDPVWRSRAIGAALLQELFALLAASAVARVEVGLPKEGFAALEATAAFYRRNGFTALGPRMRRALAAEPPREARG